MLDWFYRLRMATVGGIGWWHGRSGYPQQRHGIAVRLHAEAADAGRATDAGRSALPGDLVPLRAVEGEQCHG